MKLSHSLTLLLAGASLSVAEVGQPSCPGLSTRLAAAAERLYAGSKADGIHRMITMCNCLEEQAAESSPDYTQCSIPTFLSIWSNDHLTQACPCFRNLLSDPADRPEDLSADLPEDLKMRRAASSLSTASPSARSTVSYTARPTLTPVSSRPSMVSSGSPRSFISTGSLSSVDPASMTTAPALNTYTDGFDAFTTDAVIGTESTFDGPITGPPAPTVTLAPIAPIGLDQGSLSNVVPSTNKELWYGSNTDAYGDSSTGVVAKLTIAYQYLAIALDQIYYIQSVSCSGNSVSAVFNDTGIYQYAASLWTTQSPILFITASPSCSADGSNAYLLASSVICTDATSSCVASGSFEDIADVFSALDADWGTIVPDDNSNAPTPPAATGAANCSSPAASMISGLPAVGCGTTFDSDLDDTMGYYSGNDADQQYVLSQIAPGTPSYTSRVMRRWGILGKLNKLVTKAIVAVAKPIVKAVVKVTVAVVKDAYKYTKAAATLVVNHVVNVAKFYYHVAKFIATGKYDSNFNMKLDIAPPDSLLTDSPWDDQPGFMFYHLAVDEKDSGYSVWKNLGDKLGDELGLNKAPDPGIDFWCLNCGIIGAIKADGHLSLSHSGVQKAQLVISGNMYAGMFLGIDAFATLSKKYKKEIIKQGLPGLSIPKIFTLGPSLSLSLQATATIQGVCRALTGASLNWPNINGTIDFLNSAGTHTSGFKPIINGTLQTTKSAKLILSLGLPVAINFGIDILSGKYKKEASISEVPSLQAVLEYEESMQLIGTTDGNCLTYNTTPSTGCHGVAWNISAVNDVEFNFLENDYNLFHWESPALAKGCVGTPANATLDIITTCPDPAPDACASPPPLPSYTCGNALPTNGPWIKYYGMYSGQGHVESTSNMGNYGNPSTTEFTDLTKTTDSCAAIQRCANTCSAGGFQSFDIHHFCKGAHWECICYEGFSYYGEAWSTVNSDVDMGYGFSGYY